MTSPRKSCRLVDSQSVPEILRANCNITLRHAFLRSLRNVQLLASVDLADHSVKRNFNSIDAIVL